MSNKLNLNEIRPVPFTKGVISLNTINNTLVNNRTKVEIPLKKINIVQFSNGEREISDGLLYLISTYPVLEENETVDYLFGWDVKYEVPNDYKTAFWSCKESGPNWSKVEGCAIIPYYTAYCIDSNGVLKTRYSSTQIALGTPLKTQTDKRGYQKLKLLNKSSTTGARLHRLTALAFLPVSKPPMGDQFGMVVDHLDGNKLNNSVSNLEWVDNKVNNARANANGLISKDNNGPYMAQRCCVKTNEELYLFNSDLDACRFFNKPLLYFKQVHECGGYSIEDNFYVSLITVGAIDVVFADGSKYKIKSIKRRIVLSPVVVGYNIVTKETSIWSSHTHVKKHLGFNIDITSRLQGENNWPVNNWCFMWREEQLKGKAFRTFTPEEIEVLKDKEIIYYLYRATKNNQVTLATDVPELADKLNISKGYLYNLFKNASKINCHGYEIERLS